MTAYRCEPPAGSGSGRLPGAGAWLPKGERGPHAASHPAGRGRMAPHGAQVGVKAIWVKPLIRHWRCELGVDAPTETSPDGAAEDWAEREPGRAVLGDQRLTRRLVACARLQARQPGASFRTAAQQDGAAIAG